MATDTTSDPRVVRFGRAVIRWRWVVILASLVLTVLVTSGVRYLVFESDYRIWFSKSNPELAAFDAIQNIYTKNDSILFVIAPKGGKVFTRPVLDAIETMTREAWKIPYSRRVDSITNFQYSRAKGDDLVVTDLVKHAKTLSDAALRKARAVALKEPLLLRRLISESARVTGVNVMLQLPGKAPDELPRAVAAARALRDKIVTRYPDLDIRMTGLGMLSYAFDEASRKDLSTLTPLMFAVLLAAMVILLRSLTGTVVTMLIVALSSLVAMGAAGWLGIALTPPSVTAPTIIMTLAIADSVHLLVTMTGEMRAGRSKRDAIVESLRVNMQPVFLTSATTAVGFLSMNFSDAPPFRDLGNLTAIGVLAAYLFAIFLLPALMAVLPMRVRPAAPEGTGAMARFADFVIARRNALLWGTTVVIIALVAVIPRLDLNDEFVKYFAPGVPFRSDTDFTTANLTGLYTLEYSVAASTSGGISEPAYLNNLAAFTRWLRSQPEIVHVNALSDTMQRLNKNMHGDDPSWYRIPESRALAAQYLLLYELSLPYGLDLNDQINVDKSATRVIVTLKDMSAKELRGVAGRIDRWMKKNLPASMAVPSSGPSLMFAHISERNIKSMLGGTVLALFLISALLMGALRSLRLGLVSLIPNLVPAAMAFGLWGLLIGQVDVAVSVIAAMSLGIVVDDTIHFLSKYLRARRKRGLDVQASIRYAFATVGRALAVTTLVLVAGFLVLAFSDFAINSRMGLLTAIAIAFALAVDFLFLPPLLIKIEEKQNAAEKLAPAK